jgi:hypothetical protein
VSNWEHYTPSQQTAIRHQLRSQDAVTPHPAVLLPLATAEPTFDIQTELNHMEFWDDIEWDDILQKHPTIKHVPVTLHTQVADIWADLARHIRRLHDGTTPTTTRHQQRAWKLLLATPQLLFQAPDKPNATPTPGAHTRVVADRIRLWRAGSWHTLLPTPLETTPLSPKARQPNTAKQLQQTIKAVCTLLSEGETARALQRVVTNTNIAEPTLAAAQLPPLFQQPTQAWPAGSPPSPSAEDIDHIRASIRHQLTHLPRNRGAGPARGGGGGEGGGGVCGCPAGCQVEECLGEGLLSGCVPSDGEEVFHPVACWACSSVAWKVCELVANGGTDVVDVLRGGRWRRLRWPRLVGLLK